MDALERDFYEERRRKWRRSAFWRGFLVAAVIGVVIAGFSMSDRFSPVAPHVARFEVNGVIFDDLDREELLRDIAEQDTVRGVILRVNSPGGSAAGAEALFSAVRAIAETKPVVAVLGEVAASGGYITAIAADHVIGRGNTLTGSIGVIMEYPNVTELMSRWGIAMETVRSSEIKAEPSPFRPPNPVARALEEELVAESFGWFRDLVGSRRGLEGAALDAVATGGVFTGRLAVENGLIDAIGGEPEARAWLESRERGLGGLPVRDWEVEVDTPLVARLFSRMASSSGILGEISRLTGPKLYSIGF